jgi:hypothetical protein
MSLLADEKRLAAISLDSEAAVWTSGAEQVQSRIDNRYFSANFKAVSRTPAREENRTLGSRFS